MKSGHHWFRKWLGVRSAPSHYLEQYRSSETIGLRPKDISLWNKTTQTFYQVQFIWKQTWIQILHRVWASHYLNKWWLDVSWRFPNSSTILSANVHSQGGGLCRGIWIRRWNWSIQANPKNSSFRLVCKWVYSCNLIGSITVKRPRMLSKQFVALNTTCRPKPQLSTHICVIRPQWVKTGKDNGLETPGRFSNKIIILNI